MNTNMNIFLGLCGLAFLGTVFGIIFAICYKKFDDYMFGSQKNKDVKK